MQANFDHSNCGHLLNSSNDLPLAIKITPIINHLVIF